MNDSAGEEEEQFTATVVENEREGMAHSNFRTFSQIDCYEYDFEHDDDNEGYYKSCVKNYRINNNKPEVLFSMLVGYVDYESLVLQPPFSLAKKKTILQVFQPSNAALQKEVARRSHFLFLELSNHQDNEHPLWNTRWKKVVKPRPKQWSRLQLMHWLNQKVTTGFRGPDREFLDSELENLTKIIQSAVEEQDAHERMSTAPPPVDNDESGAAPACSRNNSRRQPPAPSWTSRSGWASLPPNLRLIEIVLLPELRQEYLTRDTALSRTELDARGTDQAPTSFWEKVVGAFNDETCVFDSSCLDSTWGGRFFLEKIPLGWESLRLVSVEKLDSPTSAKQKYMKLSNAVGNIYQRWKRSGTGEGHADDRSLSEDDEEQDATTDAAETTRPRLNVRRNVVLELAAVGGSDRFNFIGGENPAAMYLWHHLELLGLFGHSSDQVTTPFHTDNNEGPNPTSKMSKKRKGMSKAAIELTTMLKTFSKRHEQGMNKIQAAQRKLLFIQEKKATIHEKRLKMERSNLAYDQEIAVLMNTKQTLSQSMSKAIESMDRAVERADDEECDGNVARRDRWIARADEYKDRVKDIADKIGEVDAKIEEILDIRASEVDLDAGGNPAEVDDSRHGEKEIEVGEPLVTNDNVANKHKDGGQEQGEEQRGGGATKQ